MTAAADAAVCDNHRKRGGAANLRELLAISRGQRCTVAGEAVQTEVARA
jgi:hypothetical protein